MPSCDACGANVEDGENKCPFCGHTLMKIVNKHPEPKDKTDIFRVDRDSGKVHFGDGITGARPPAGDNLSSSYRVGGGKRGSLPCSVCKHVNPPAANTCEACGAELQKRILHRRRLER